MRTTIETHPTGTFFDFADPRPEMIHVEDIARSLSQQCRFGGFTTRWYSVADHALLVHSLVREVAGPELAFAALHHDSHEAYLGDIPTPLKPRLGPRFKLLANEIDFCIASRFGLPVFPFKHDIIKAADEQALAIEASVLKRSRGLGAHWPSTHETIPELPTGAVPDNSPQWSEALFLVAHHNALSAMLTERQPA